jgi:hypothetical protein
MPEATTEKPADRYAKLELFGHQTLVGRVSEVEQFGGKMGRIDCPNGDGTETTILFRPESVYRLTYVTAGAVAALADLHAPEPVNPWDLPDEVKLAMRAARQKEAAGPPALRPAATDPIDAEIPFDTGYPAKPAYRDDQEERTDEDDTEEDAEDIRF